MSVEITLSDGKKLTSEKASSELLEQIAHEQRYEPFVEIQDADGEVWIINRAHVAYIRGGTG